MKKLIEKGDVYIGIEFGSTRIKAVMTDADGRVLASGVKNWENLLERRNNITAKEAAFLTEPFDFNIRTGYSG